MTGVYSGAISVKELLSHGDFGLGTFDNLDDEMVVVDGQAYRVRGRVMAMPPKTTADQAYHFTMFTMKAILDGRAAELIDLAKTNLTR